MNRSTIDEPFVHYALAPGEIAEFANYAGVGHSITFAPEYRAFSFEELRVNDYTVAPPPMRAQLDNTAQTATNSPGLPVNTQSDKLTHCGGNGLKLVFNPFKPPAALDTRRISPRPNPYESKLFTFRVGQDRPRDFIVHEALLKATPGFTALILKSDWKEIQDCIIPLPDDQPANFEIYQQWLYERCICVPETEDHTAPCSTSRALASAFIFGDKFLDFDFCDAVMDCIIEQIWKTSAFDISLVEHVWRNTTPSSPLRRLILDLYDSVGTERWLEQLQNDDQFHAEFMKDVMRDQMKERLSDELPDEDPPFLRDPCAYHKHSNVVCYQKSQRRPCSFEQIPM